ncbi:S8 family serine peptidase [Rhizosaccharibacter radicis]|uniref:S8 family serine peptidase n=1 Tax=Rhizosaccharibacter radicis TaxID=2782605 RepID=A0ABT1VVR9_9PROT|nr:S8 family serine peptidase [Acetobacteraceae bacterium KSS12]
MVSEIPSPDGTGSGDAPLVRAGQKLVLLSKTEWDIASLRFAAPQISGPDPDPLTVGGVLAGNASVLDGLDLSGSGFGIGDGIDISDVAARSTTDPSGRAVTASYDPVSGRLRVLADGAAVATLSLPTGLGGMFSVGRDGSGGSTIVLVHGQTDAAAVASGSARAEALYGTTGAGIAIGIISDSFNASGGLYQDVLTGALPGSVLDSYDPTLDASHQTDEGRAMAQIVHDVAPGSTLLFSAANNGDTTDAAMANAMSALVARGARVIVDDLGDGPGPFYHLNPLTAAVVADATSKGVVFVTAATNRGTDIFYENTLALTRTRISGIPGDSWAFDFGHGAEPVFYQHLVLAGGAEQTIDLQWHATGQPFTLTASFFTKSNGTYVPLATTVTDPDGQASYRFRTTGEGPEDVYLALTSNRPDAAGIFKYIVQDKGVTAPVIDDAHANIGSGVITAHELDPNEISVGMIDYRDVLSDKTPLAAAPGSSYGPGILYENPDGTPLAVPVALSKPDITAPQHTSTTVIDPTEANPTGIGGLSVFEGTSAASPVVAGIAAMMLQADGKLTPGDIANLLRDSARVMQDPTRSGAGLVQAEQAVFSAGGGVHRITQFVGGNDVLLGTHSDDLITTNRDDSTVSGGAGNDTVHAGGHSTSVVGGSGSLFLDASAPVTLSGGTGTVTAFTSQGGLLAGGSDGANVMVAAGGNTTLMGGGSGNALWGGAGTATIFSGATSDTIGGGSGSTTMIAGAGTVTVVTGVGSNTVFGGSGGATIWDDGGRNLVLGGSGDSVFHLGRGETTAWGGTGLMTLEVVKDQAGGSFDFFQTANSRLEIDLKNYGGGDVQKTATTAGTFYALSDGTRIQILHAPGTLAHGGAAG